MDYTENYKDPSRPMFDPAEMERIRDAVEKIKEAQNKVRPMFVVPSFADTETDYAPISSPSFAAAQRSLSNSMQASIARDQSSLEIIYMATRRMGISINVKRTSNSYSGSGDYTYSLELPALSQRVLQYLAFVLQAGEARYDELQYEREKVSQAFTPPVAPVESIIEELKKKGLDEI